MVRYRSFLATAVWVSFLIFSVPTLVGAQSNKPESVPIISPRDWVAPAIQAVVLLVIVLLGLRQFQKFTTQRERSSEKENQQKQLTDIQDRLVSSDPAVRAQAALRLAEFGKMMVPTQGSKEQAYPYFIAAAAQLSTALHLETNPGIRSSARESLQMLADFATSLQSEFFLKTLVIEAADANRTARSAFIKALAEYTATLPMRSYEEQITLKRLAALAKFGDKPEATASILKSLMELHEFTRDKEIYAAVRDTLDYESLRRSDVMRLSQVESTAAALRETRDALAYALRCIAPPPNTPAELEKDPQIAERKPSDTPGQSSPHRLNLAQCFLAGAQLNRSYLRRVDLRDAFLQGTSLVATDLQGALLINAQMQGAALGYAQLQWANLNNARMEQANLTNAKLKGASLNEARLFEADMIGVSFQDTSLVNADFVGACLIGASFEGACLYRGNFQEANLIRANLRKAYLNEANLRKAYLTEAQLQEAVLTSADLTGAILMQARLEGAQLKGAQLDHAQVFGAVLEGMLDGRRVGAELDKASLKDLDLRNPMTGQIDNQIRGWLIRYFPREAYYLAIGKNPVLTASGSEQTLELPAPHVPQYVPDPDITISPTAFFTPPVAEIPAAIQSPKVTESPLVSGITRVTEPQRSMEVQQPVEPPRVTESVRTVEIPRPAEPAKVVEQPRAIDIPPVVVNPPSKEPIKIAEPAKTVQPAKVVEAAPVSESLQDALVVAPQEEEAEFDPDDHPTIIPGMGDQKPLPKGWRYSEKVLVISVKPEQPEESLEATPIG